MKKKIRKIVAVVFAMLITTTVSTQAWAADAVDETAGEGLGWYPCEELVDELTDNLTRSDSPPTEPYDLTNKTYSAGFSIYSYTYSGRYFKPSSSGVLYYSLVKCYGNNCTITVKTYCKECNEVLCSRSFEKTEADQTWNRKVTISDAHKTHGIYFRIGKNGQMQLGGTLKVSRSSINA